MKSKSGSSLPSCSVSGTRSATLDTTVLTGAARVGNQSIIGKYLVSGSMYEVLSLF